MTAPFLALSDHTALLSSDPADKILLSSAASLWTPADIPGLIAAWDFSDTSKITASGGSVSQVNGAYGTSYALTQGTGSLQPTTGTRTLNGLNALDFDADVLVNSSFPNSTIRTMVVVNASDTFGYDRNLIGHGTGNWDGVEELNIHGSGYYYTYSGTFVTSTAALVIGAVNVVAATLATGSAMVRLNGVNGTPADRGAADFGSGTTLTIGAWNTTGAYAHNGAMGEVHLYDSVLSEATLDLLDAFLDPKWKP